MVILEYNIKIYHVVCPQRIRITLAWAGTGVAQERGPLFGIIEGEGDVRYSITVDDRDRQKKREKHFYFLEENLVGMFPRLTLTSPDKSSVKMKVLQL